MYQNMKSAFNKVLPYQESEAVRTIVLVGGFALLTALGALIRIPLPFTSVPITLQTFFVLLAGVMLGSKRGTLSQMVYVSAGAAGLPIFAGMMSGLVWLKGDTGGFLAGFILAPAVVSSIIGESTNRWRLILALIAGTALIFVLGNLWLWNLARGGQPDVLALGAVPWLWNLTRGSLADILVRGVFPFLPGAVIKIGLVIAVVEAIKYNRKDK